jgi:hypothetical protein
MVCTQKAWCFVGAVAVATWLAAAPVQAQGRYQTIAHQQSDEADEEISELRSEISELRSNLKDSASGGYEQGPACGGCGCDHGCGQACGCGDSCGCETCGCEQCCTGGTCGCFEPCCHPSGLWASAELLWFRYHRADGVRVGVDGLDPEEFDFEPTLRLTAGWVRDDGLGVRLRYWEFDHNSNNDGDDERLFVDTYTFDFELFDTFCLNRNWDLEIAAGIRYNEFSEVMFDPQGPDVRLNAFQGFGVLAGAELRRCIGTSGVVWVRARASILMDDKDIFNNENANNPQQERLLDATVGMTELAFGYDYVMPMCNGSYAFAGVQAEWQNWYNYTSSFENTANDEDFGGPSDVGFGGFGVRAGIAR